MIKLFVKGNWLTNIVQPHIILRHIHRNELGTVVDQEEDSDYNVTFFISKCSEVCIDRLKEEFPQYEFICIQ